jgi:xanthine dehydrogenase large subunit
MTGPGPISGDATPSRISGGVRRSVSHDSALKHTQGSALYVDDISAPANCLNVHIALSDRAHARILSVDLNAVRSAPGVVCVLTAEDIPGSNDVAPVFGDDPMFVVGAREALVQCAGQSLFAVAADTLEQARRAATLAKIEYADLPALLDIEAAMQAKAFFEEPYTFTRGEAKPAISGARHQLSGRIEIGGQEHFYLEGHAALAIPAEDGDINLHCSSQHPSEIQHKVAGMLDVPNNAINVQVRRMGGGFGGKETQGSLPAAVAALAARLTGRPAKVRYDRDDDMRVTGKRHDFRIDYTVGFDDQGRIVGIEMDQAARCGMSHDLSLAICDRAMFHADNCYYLPAATITSYRCRTNTVSNTAFRGFGGPQGMVGIERVIDEIAHHLGKDPLDVRRANFYAAPGEAAGRNVTPYHMTVEDCVIGDLVDDLVASSDYLARRDAIRVWNENSPVLKRGIALTPVKFGISFTVTHLNQAGALVHVYSDGSVQLNHGGTEMGQGLFLKVAQVVAEEFQIDLERIKITATDTAKVPNTSPTAASSGTDLNAMAARNAAKTIKDRMIQFLAEHWSVAPSSIVFDAGEIRSGDHAMSFDELAHAAYMERVSLSSTGYYATPKISWDRKAGRGRPFYYFAYGAAVCEVAIDTLTGENRILRADLLQDVGKSINPAIDLGQIEGAFVQGAGWLTTEELVFDAAGILKTHAPSTYKIPTIADRAPDMRIALWDRGENREDVIYKSKAVGEPPFMLGISALMALSDAIAQARPDDAYPDLDSPATPERVLMAVAREGQK